MGGICFTVLERGAGCLIRPRSHSGALTLGVNHERPSPRLGHNNAVVHAEGIDGQASDVPGSDSHRLTQRQVEGEIWGTGDLFLQAQIVPLLDHSLQTPSKHGS